MVEADLVLDAGCDPAAVGAAVTVELCGHWEHDGRCRWPHNNEIDARRSPARFRTLFVADDTEVAVINRRIEAALQRADSWRVVSLCPRGVAPAEAPLAARLLSGG